jgi:hypothetical protein
MDPVISHSNSWLYLNFRQFDHAKRRAACLVPCGGFDHGCRGLSHNLAHNFHAADGRATRKSPLPRGRGLNFAPWRRSAGEGNATGPIPARDADAQPPGRARRRSLAGPQQPFDWHRATLAPSCAVDITRWIAPASTKRAKGFLAFLRSTGEFEEQGWNMILIVPFTAPRVSLQTRPRGMMRSNMRT